MEQANWGRGILRLASRKFLRPVLEFRLECPILEYTFSWSQAYPRIHLLLESTILLQSLLFWSPLFLKAFFVLESLVLGLRDIGVYLLLECALSKNPLTQKSTFVWCPPYLRNKSILASFFVLESFIPRVPFSFSWSSPYTRIHFIQESTFS